jgi:hypothetical protein
VAPLSLSAAGLALAGCAIGPLGAAGATPSPPARHSAVAPGEPLMAILQPGGYGQVAAAHDRVALVSFGGQVVRRESFPARPVPRIGPAQPVMQPEAVAAAGRVYYADGTGQVRSLAPNGTVAPVTRFPLDNSQRVLSFVVSPDGARLVATVFTWPPPHNPPPQTPVQPAFAPGDMTLDVYTATPGQTPARVLHRIWPQGNQLPRDVMQAVAWSSGGPLITTDTVLGTNSGLQGGHFFGHLAELDDAGGVRQRVGGGDCSAVSVTADETVLCMDRLTSNASVRSRTGALLYSLPPASTGPLPTATGASQQAAVLSPDGQRAVSGGAVVGRDGTRVQLPAQFAAEGWADARTLVGVRLTNQGESNLELVHLSNTHKVVDLGLKGLFVGMVRG